MADPLQPSLSLLVKLGTALVHAEELASYDGHTFDLVALQSVCSDPEVRAWRKQMDDLAMLPRKRSADAR